MAVTMKNILPAIGVFESVESINTVPAISEGGLLVMSLLLVTAAACVLARRKQPLQAGRPEQRLRERYRSKPRQYQRSRDKHN